MAIQPIKFLVSPSATATNGSKTITVTGNVDCSHVYSGTAIALGTRQVVEAVSGTKPDGSGNSVITLRDDWTDPTTTAKLVAFNTIEGLAEAIRRAREVVQASEAALSGNVSYMGDHSAATGNFPAAPGEGLGSQIYRISIAGTISEREYKVGELIYYDQYFSQWRSFFDGFGTAAQRNAGTGTADLPDNDQLNLRLGTTGNLGNAAQRNVGTATNNLPDNAQLNSRLGSTGNLGSAALAALIGTVAMSGGVPSGAAFEIGSNPNGRFIIFADGSCIAFRAKVPTLSNPNSPDGNIFLSSNQDYSFPVTFVGDVYKDAEVFGPRTEAVWVVNPTSSGTDSFWRVRMASSRSIAVLNALLNLYAFGKTL